MMNLSVRNLCYIGMLVTLNVVLTRVFSLRIPFEGIEGIRIGFGTLPVILAGLLFGSRQGFITGAVGDIIGFQLNPSGLYIPTFTIVAGISGAFPPFMIKWFCNRSISLKKLSIVIAINNMITALMLTPCLLQFHFGIPILATIPGRVISQVVLIPCIAIMVNLLIKRLKEIGIHPHYPQNSMAASKQCDVPF